MVGMSADPAYGSSKWELLFTDPLVITAMACPPYWAGTTQDTDNAGTTFGTATGSEVESETSLGFTAGFSIGGEFSGGLFTQSRTTLKLTIETAVDWVSKSSVSIEKSYSYNGGGTTDSAFFSGTVGNIIDPVEYADKWFNFGFFVEPKSYKGQKFVVINYFVN